MGLHQLSEDQDDMPPDDPAWPPGKNALKRETALRLWGFLCFFDHLSACVAPQCPLPRPERRLSHAPSDG